MVLELALVLPLELPLRGSDVEPCEVELDDGLPTSLAAFFLSILCMAFAKKSLVYFLILACFSSVSLSSLAVEYEDDFFSFSAIETVH